MLVLHSSLKVLTAPLTTTGGIHTHTYPRDEPHTTRVPSVQVCIYIYIHIYIYLYLRGKSKMRVACDKDNTWGPTLHRRNHISQAFQEVYVHGHGLKFSSSNSESAPKASCLL